MGGFTKLWSEIVTSSIWNESDKTRIVWVTMLAIMGPDMMVRASVGGLAHQARVTREECEKALQILESPDDDSRSKEHEGRRIQRVDGGFLILNGQKYRERRCDDDRRAYMRDYMKKYRSRVNINVNSGKTELAQAEAEAEADNKKGTHSRVREFPTRDDVTRYAKSAPVPISIPCAERFHDEMEACGWLDAKHRPVRDWMASLRAYASRWNENDKARGSGQRNDTRRAQKAFQEFPATHAQIPLPKLPPA